MRTSKLWILGPPFAILITLLVYYVKFPTFKTWLDSRVPWVKENVAPRLPALQNDIEDQIAQFSRPKIGSPIPGVDDPSASRPQPPQASLNPAPSPSAAQAIAPSRSYLLKDGTVDLEGLAGDPSAWPKSLTLRKPAQFPAVQEGQVVGTLQAPLGSEVKLRKIHQGKLGVEFNGGGGWLTVDDTDLREKLR
jgi:hypothetical protein